jgi:cellulose synthase/poly-beta-1,6-N-acetylglucosamine synthase-like glycosyltransferase
MQATIGMTAYNEEKNIGKLLEFLINEKFSFNLKEIIVVASGCTDKTEEIIKMFIKRNKKGKLIKEEVRKGKVSAVNIILKKAKGDVIIFVCADNLPKKDSINKLIKKFSNKMIGAISGRPIPMENKNTLFGYVSHLIWDMHHKVCIVNPKISGELFAIRKKIVENIPYNIINDDGYMTAITRKKGYKIVYEKEAITYMTGKNSLLTHMRRRRRIARGYIQLKKLGLNVNISLKVIFKALIKRNEKEPLKTLFVLFLEIIANLLAYYDALLGKTPYCWKK